MAGYIGTKASVVTPGAERKKVFSITTTTSSLTGLAYTPGFVHVFHNGVRLVDGTDYTATNGTSITLTTAAQNGDEVVVISYATFEVADAYTKAESDDRYVNVTGDTMTGALAVNGNLTVDTNTLFVDAANNRVGVGTSSPEGNLHVLNSSAGTVTAPANFPLVLEGTTVAGISVLTSNTGEGRIWFGDPDDNDVGRIEYAHSTNAMTFRTNASDRMVIDSSGNLLVGTTVPPSSGNGGSGFVADTDNRRVLELRSNANSSLDLARFYTASGLAGSISSSFTSTAYNTSSDYRLKENVVPLSGAADRLAQIPVHRFNFIADPDRTVDGFLAHEVQEIVPECVTGQKDQVETVEVTDEDGNVTTETRPVYQGIDQSKLVPLLTAALQEALTKINALEARIVTLEGGAA